MEVQAAERLIRDLEEAIANREKMIEDELEAERAARREERRLNDPNYNPDEDKEEGEEAPAEEGEAVEMKEL